MSDDLHLMLCYDKKPLSICHIRCGGIGTGLRSNCSACETGSNNHHTDKVCPRDQIGQGFSIKAYEIFAKISGSNLRWFSNNVRVLEYNLVLIPVIGALLRTPRSISEIFIIDFFGVFTSPAAPYQ